MKINIWRHLQIVSHKYFFHPTPPTINSISSWFNFISSQMRASIYYLCLINKVLINQLICRNFLRFIFNQVEYFYPQDRLRAVASPRPAISCKRCELDQPRGVRSQWGFDDNSLGLGSLASAVRTRSGFRSTPPRVTAYNWRDRL